MPTAHVIGSGISGLCSAYALRKAGGDVTLTTASNGPDESCCSWWAGGMLAPFCEMETAEPLIGKLGAESIEFWQQIAKKTELNYVSRGTLVVASARDQSLLRTFAKQTQGHTWLNEADIRQREPELEQFQRALSFQDEAHIEPRLALKVLWGLLQEMGVKLETNQFLTDAQLDASLTEYDWQLDCRGLAAQTQLKDLRGVKGEMLHIYSEDVQLNGTLRLLHPRMPLYIVPRPNNQFMVGATMIESNGSKRATVRSVLELLSAAYAVHPAFAEAEIVEIGVDARPGFADNLPHIRQYGNRVYINGLYRHGYLGAPALAKRAVDLILHQKIDNEVVDAHYPERSENRYAANDA